MSPSHLAVDILVYVALNEELGYALEGIKNHGTNWNPGELTNVALTYYTTQVTSPSLNRTFTMMIVPAGKMGNTRSANVTSALLSSFKIDNVVVLGIAGSLTTDLSPGDVYIPDRVEEYLANSAAQGTEQWTFHTSGNHFSTHPRLLNRFQNFSHTHESEYKQWLASTQLFREKAIKPATVRKLKSAGIVLSKQCKLSISADTVLGSGPTVGKSEAFITWLKTVDRKMEALEMESAGVHDASFVRTPSPRTIAIRGISDFADERKRLIEDGAKSQFCILAVQNAVSLLIYAVEAGFFREELSQHQGNLPSGSIISPSTIGSGSNLEHEGAADRSASQSAPPENSDSIIEDNLRVHFKSLLMQRSASAK